MIDSSIARFCVSMRQTETTATGEIRMKSEMLHFFWLTAVPLYYIYRVAILDPLVFGQLTGKNQ